MLISQDKLADLAWLGLDKYEIEECGVGPLAEGLFHSMNERVPLNLLSVFQNPDYFPFLCTNIFNIDPLPIQHVCLKELWNHPFPMLIGSRGFGKTFMLALYALMRAFLLQPRKVIVAGAAFRQSKIVGEYVEHIWQNAPILQDICKGQKGMRKDVDRWEIKIGTSSITFIPIGDGTKIRGLRGNDVITDEFASIPEEIFEVVLAGFGAVSSTPISNVKLEAKRKYLIELGKWTDEAEDEFVNKLGNQLVVSGTAFYRFNHFYKYYKRYCDIIRSKGDKDKLEIIMEGPLNPRFSHKDFSVIRYPYELIPEGFMDARLVARARATVDKSRYQMEYGAIFPEDSNGFFSRKLIESCVANDRNNIQLPSGRVEFGSMLHGHANKQYVFGVDPASEKDNFSIIILELWPEHQRIVYSWTTTRTKHREKIAQGFTEERDFYSYCCRKIRNLMKTFPTDHIAIDTQGGGRAIEEGLHDDDKMEKGEIALWPVYDPDGKDQPTDHEEGLHILHMINFSDSKWVSDANHGLRKDLEDKVLLFPAVSSAIIGVAMELDMQSKRQFDTIEDCVFEIEELKDELASIEYSQTGVSMRDRWDTPEIKLPGNKKGRQRKDRYSSLVMANMVARCIRRVATSMTSEFIGGFADEIYNTENYRRGDNRLYKTGPEWFTKWAESEYGS